MTLQSLLHLKLNFLLSFFLCPWSPTLNSFPSLLFSPASKSLGALGINSRASLMLSFSLIALTIIHILVMPKVKSPIQNHTLNSRHIYPTLKSASPIRCLNNISTLTQIKQNPNLLCPSINFSDDSLLLVIHPSLLLFPTPHPVIQENPVGSTFNINPESNLFTVLPLLTLWFRTPSSLNLLIVVGCINLTSHSLISIDEPHSSLKL